MGKTEGKLESLVNTLVSGVMLIPFVVLGMIPISGEAKMVLVVMVAIPYMFAYLKVIFWVEDWFNERRSSIVE